MIVEVGIDSISEKSFFVVIKIAKLQFENYKNSSTIWIHGWI